MVSAVRKAGQLPEFVSKQNVDPYSYDELAWALHIIGDVYFQAIRCEGCAEAIREQCDSYEADCLSTKCSLTAIMTCLEAARAGKTEIAL